MIVEVHSYGGPIVAVVGDLVVHDQVVDLHWAEFLDRGGNAPKQRRNVFLARTSRIALAEVMYRVLNPLSHDLSVEMLGQCPWGIARGSMP
jgi:hypothetical protein